MNRGKIKTLTEKGYGFITVEDRKKDLFFHSKALENVAFDNLQVGDELEFDIEESEKGPHAVNINAL